MIVTKAVKLLTRELWRASRRELNFHTLKPSQALLFLTYRCTGRCQVCSMWRRSADPAQELSLQDWQGVLDQLAEMGVKVVEFFGGDALLRKDVLINLIRYARRKGFLTELPTNSILLDKETARELVASGLDVLYISLDGLATVHDQARGAKGAFDRVQQAVQDVLECRGSAKRPKVIFNTTISKLNLDTFEGVVTYARQVGADAVDLGYVGEISPRSISASSLDGLSPTPFFVTLGASHLLDRPQAVELKRKLRQLRQMPSNGTRLNTAKIDLLSIDNLTNGTFQNKKCYICRDFVTIDPYGNVVGCLHFNNNFLGNTAQEPLKAIWQGARHRKFTQGQLEGKFDICRHCSNGARHNQTFWRSLQGYVYEAKGWARDERG